MYRIFSTILLFLDSTQISKSKRKIYNLFLPIFVILEWLTHNYFWQKIIIPEILTKDEVVDFLDKNEFGYKWHKIYKKDIVEDMRGLNNEQMAMVIYDEFLPSFLQLFEKNTNLDIENYVELAVTCDRMPINANTVNIYTVTLRFYRAKFMWKATHKLFIYFLVVGAIAALYVYLLPIVGKLFGLN